MDKKTILVTGGTGFIVINSNDYEGFKDIMLGILLIQPRIFRFKLMRTDFTTVSIQCIYFNYDKKKDLADENMFNL